MKAIILAGGFGTRLRSVNASLPKPMVDIGGRPFLELLLDYLRGFELEEVALCVHHMAGKIERHFGDNYHGVTVRYAREDAPLGTGGAMKNALEMLRPEEPVIGLNGDSFVRVDYRAMLECHNAGSSPITLALRHMDDTGRYGRVTVQGGKVAEFASKSSGDAGLINTGVYIIEPHLFDGFDMPRAFSLERDFFQQHARALRPGAFIMDDYFIDIGVPEDYARACEELPSMRYGG